MEKISASYVVKKLVDVSSNLDNMGSIKASEQLIICAEKINNRDESAIENFDIAVKILKAEKNNYGEYLDGGRDMVKEASGWKDVVDKGKAALEWGKGVGRGLRKDVPEGLSEAKGKIEDWTGEAKDWTGEKLKGVQKGVQQGLKNVKEYGFKYTTDALRNEVNRALAEFKRTLDTSHLINLESVISKYKGFRKNIPQAVLADFDNYFGNVERMYKEAEGWNADLVKKFIAKAKEFEGILSGLDKAVEEKLPAYDEEQPYLEKTTPIQITTK